MSERRRLGKRPANGAASSTCRSAHFPLVSFVCSIARTVAKPLPNSKVGSILSSVRGGVLSRVGAGGAGGAGDSDAIHGPAAKQSKLHYGSSAGGAAASSFGDVGSSSSSSSSSSSGAAVAAVVGMKRHADGSAVLATTAAAAPTPGRSLLAAGSRTAGLNPLLPRTPAAGAGAGAARKPKKGETAIMVAVSVNGSPLAVPVPVPVVGAGAGAGAGAMMLGG